MFKKIIKVVVAAFLLFVSFGLLSSGIHESDDTNYLDVVTSKLKMSEGAYDDEFGLSVDSPFLIREVLMYQNIKRDNQLFQDFFPSAIVAFKDSVNTNPPFPKDPASKTFYGQVETEDGLILGACLTEKLFNLNSINLHSPLKKLEVSGIKAFDGVDGLSAINDATLTNNPSGNWQVGDIIIRWYSIDPNSITQTYTLVGAKFDEDIGGGICQLYDSIKTRKEIFPPYNFEDISVGVVLGLIGVAFLISAFRKKGPIGPFNF